MSTTRKWISAISLCFVVLGGGLSLEAQTTGGTYRSDSYYIQAPVPMGETVPERIDDRTLVNAWKADFEKYLLPGWKSRFGRSLSFSASLLDQPDYIPIGESTENPSGFLPNSTDKLGKFDISLSPGQWFRKSSDFSAAYALGKSSATAVLIDFSSDPLAALPPSLKRLNAGHVTKLQFLAWAGKGSGWKRLASAVGFTVAASERSAWVGSVPIPDSIRDRDRVVETYSLKLDAKHFLLFPGQVSAAYTALEAHTAISRLNRSGLEEGSCEAGQDSGNPVSCLEKLSKLKVSRRGLAGLVPSVEFKTVDEFDFVLSAGNFVGSRFLEDSLWTFNVTWDLGSALDTANHRREAIKAIALHHQLVKRDQMRNDELVLSVGRPGSVLKGQLLYLPLIAKYKTSKVLPLGSWAATAKEANLKSPCERSPTSRDSQKGLHELDLKLSSDGILSGYPPEGNWDINVVFTDPHKNQAMTCTTLKVRTASLGW